MDITEANGQLLKALQVALARQQEEQPLVTSTNPAGPIAQALTRCVVSSWRIEATRRETSKEIEVELGKEFGALVASLLSMNRGLLYTPLAHEAICPLRPQRGGGQSYAPREVVRVVGVLASVILLQPECELLVECGGLGTGSLARIYIFVKRYCTDGGT